MTINLMPLRGRRVGVTAVRRAQEQIDLFERRGARVDWAPALSPAPSVVDPEDLRLITQAVLAGPIDLFLATTGTGVNAWFDAADMWGMGGDLTAAIAGAEILARGPKSTGALRRRGLREDWSPSTESFADVLGYLANRDLSGRRIVLQEHGQSLALAAQTLRERGAEVIVVSVYRIEAAESPGELIELMISISRGDVDVVTFTSAPAVASFIDVAVRTGKAATVIEAVRRRVILACVGPIAADAFSAWNVPVLVPNRFRLGAMVKLIEMQLSSPA